MLTDPIFQGLAASLLFGPLSSTLRTVLVIPAIHVVLRVDGRPGVRRAAENPHAPGAGSTTAGSDRQSR